MLTSLSQNGCGMAKTMDAVAGPRVPTCVASGVRRNFWLVGGGLMDLHPRLLGTKAAYPENVDVEWDTHLAENPSGRCWAGSQREELGEASQDTRHSVFQLKATCSIRGTGGASCQRAHSPKLAMPAQRGLRAGSFPELMGVNYTDGHDMAIRGP